MTKSIKNVMAGILMVPALALGLLVSAPLTSQVSAAPDCSNPIGLSIADAAACSNKARGVDCLFGEGCVLNTVINFALYFIGAISELMLIIGGIRYTTSAGNDKSVAAAKNTIMYAVIGVVVALLAYAIVNFVLTTFTATA
jgi:hypothetical protein